jgi:hypothetical protein
MSKDSFYFSHDSNARHDPKITAMRGVYGSEGYGWYWMLIEMLRESDGYKLDMQSKYIFNAFALQMQSDALQIKNFVQDCINEFNLFQSDGNFFWSESLLRRMEFRDEKSEKRRKAANVRWEKERNSKEKCKTDANASENNANGMQEKESKVNKKKDIYIVFEHWKSKNIINHKSLSSKMESHINARINEYGVDPVLKAIDNYDIVLNDEQYYWTHRWTLQDFMKPNNMIRFLDESAPFTTLRSNKNQTAGISNKPNFTDLV